jgi:ubiquinone/menaquinone biosynthesis C-methylase UbiE
MDIKAISRTIFRNLKIKLIGKSQYGNKQWEKADETWYSEIHNQNTELHKNFQNYLKSKNDVTTILEVGCGTGVYPIQQKDLFGEKKYTGLDFSKPNIEFCKERSDFEFIQGDFIKMNLDRKFDLVYSHAVIDHVYDIDEFLRKIIKLCKKYAYVNAYRGYFPEINEHIMHWRDDDNCYYNDLSVKKSKKILLESGLTENEFEIKKQENIDTNGKIWYETIIEITKNK